MFIYRINQMGVSMSLQLQQDHSSFKLIAQHDEIQIHAEILQYTEISNSHSYCNTHFHAGILGFILGYSEIHTAWPATLSSQHSVGHDNHVITHQACFTST